MALCIFGFFCTPRFSNGIGAVRIEIPLKRSIERDRVLNWRPGELLRWINGDRGEIESDAIKPVGTGHYIRWCIVLAPLLVNCKCAVEAKILGERKQVLKQNWMEYLPNIK